MAWHGYVLVVDIALTLGQRADVLAAFAALSAVEPRRISHLMTMRAALDGSAAIYECRFNENHLSVAAVKNYLAAAVGVDPGIINDDLTQTEYGPEVVFSVAGTDRMAVLLFGGLGASKDESAVAVRDFMADFEAAWEPDD